MACFFEDFVIAPNSMGPCNGFYPHLEEMCAEQAGRDGDSYLMVATRAAACAAFANRHSCDGLMVRARSHYGKALGSVHQALSDPFEAVRDEALTAVTLLGMYEVYHPLSQTLSPLASPC